MGATTFSTTAVGKTADAAFTEARNEALYQYGHNGYTGTIAEKRSYQLITDSLESIRARYERLPEPELRRFVLAGLQEGKREYMAAALLDLNDPRIDNKYGPAGCIDLGPAKDGKQHKYLFFGWAAE
jgi:hypothetical protein